MKYTITTKDQVEAKNLFQSGVYSSILFDIYNNMHRDVLYRIESGKLESPMDVLDAVQKKLNEYLDDFSLTHESFSWVSCFHYTLLGCTYNRLQRA